MLAKQDKRDEALAAYDALGNSQSNARLRELALLFAANVLVDKGDVPGVKQRVLGLTAADDPLRNSAHEAIGLAQYKSGDLDGARDSFNAVINDPTSPDEVRGRMQLFIAQLVAEGATPLPAPVAQVNGATPDAAAAAAVSAINAAVQAGATSVTPPVTAPAANDNAPAAPASITAPAATTPAAGTAAPAATPATTPADATTPAGVESSQPSTPDNSALDLAVPAPATSGTAAPATASPALSTGLPTPTDTTTQPASAATTSKPAPAATTVQPAPATTPSQSAPANGATQPAPANGTIGQ